MPKLKQIENPNQLLFDFDSYIETNYLEVDSTHIDNELPELFPEQREDVLKAEKRFEVGKGMLFTNGTGTGKTFVGLGAIKRFYNRGKKNIIIIVPTDKKAKDWIEEGEVLSLEITQFLDTKTANTGISVTTYANFYQNEAIESIDYDLVVYDECHYLLQNAQGNYTQALWKHKTIAKLPSSFKENIVDEIKYYCPVKEGYTHDHSLYERIYNERLEEYINKTKVLFLSATPFAYHKSLLLGDGCLWDIFEKPCLEAYESRGYNDGNEWERFLVSNFGYRMRYNKANIPDASVDVSLMERQFFENQVELGVISGRKIDVDKDYSREFISLDSDLGFKIDEGIKLFYDSDFTESYPILTRYSNRKYNYLYLNQLLECIKCREVIPRIKEHLRLGRKIVLFHSYNNSFPAHPFKFNPYQMLKSEDDMRYIDSLNSDIDRFEDEYSHLVNLDLEHLANPIQTLKEEFSSLLQFNGKVPKKKRVENAGQFNFSLDNNIILCQVRAAKEGISFHDQLGEKQRVLMVLGLPTAPTDAIQIEGRIFRLGLLSNAIYEYLTLQTNFERFAFATKIAERSRTAENLAMGEKARNLELVFTEGYLNAHDDEPNLNQGVGGKESDYTFEEISEFEKSKTYYFSQGKKTSKNKSREGFDYFATPEPLGLKIAEWLELEPGEKALEPSAGHGAIARFFPENTENVFVEQSFELASKLAINTHGTVKTTRFEDYYVGNKFEGVAMNPPFGRSGKTAMEHIEKAVKHLSWRQKSKVIAIIPNGPAMQKRLDYYLEDKKPWEVQLLKEIILPSVAFERAGTSVWTKIIVLGKSDEKEYVERIDLSRIKDINDFFDEIECL